MKNNIEYGVLLNGNIVKDIEKEYLNLFKKDEYPIITDELIGKAREIINAVPKERRKRFAVDDKQLFEEFLNDENIDEKFEGGIDVIKDNLTLWKKDVFNCLLNIGEDIFSLEDVYKFEGVLQELHLENENIKPKIRQQLQYLRNVGLVEFVKPGIYKKLWV